MKQPSLNREVAAREAIEHVRFQKQLTARLILRPVESRVVPSDAPDIHVEQSPQLAANRRGRPGRRRLSRGDKQRVEHARRRKTDAVTPNGAAEQPEVVQAKPNLTT